MPDLDRYLYDHLRSQAAGVDVPAGDIDTVMARGRRRRHRRTGAGVLAIVAAAGTVTGVVVSNSSGGRHGEISVGSPTSLPAATGAQLTWRVTPASAGLSDLTSLSSSGSIAYAVSTAPGVVPAGDQAAQQLYRSADGLSWTTATGPTGVSAASVAVDGNRVYTVGTGPATAATGVSGAVTTDVSWTDDSGGSWQNSVLPIDVSAPAGAATSNGETVNVAAGPKGVVAAVGVGVTVDLTKLVSGVSAKTMWTTNTNGVEVLGSALSSQCSFSAADNSVVSRQSTLQESAAAQLKASYAARGAPLTKTGPAVPPSGAGFAKTPVAPEGQVSTVPCVDASGQVTHYVPADQAYQVVTTYTWSQLSLGGQMAQVLQGEPLVFYSSDGTHFQQVSLPAGMSGAPSVTATPSGFAMEVPEADGSGSPVVAQSVDGQHWTMAPFALPVGATGATAIGYVGGHLVVIGETQTGSAAYTLLNNGWQTTTLPTNVFTGSFGPLGVALIGLSGSGDANSWQVLFSGDGAHWSSASLVSLSGGDVNGANVLVGAHQVVVTVSRPPAQPSSPTDTQVQLVGTPAS